jgi:hypothetical protein
VKLRRSTTFGEALKLAETYYSKDSHSDARGLLQDCVRRGLLAWDDSGGLSFGHLTYQEYLAAEWLAERNPRTFIWSRLLTPWWSKVLQFYAARKMDITFLVREGLRYRGESASMERVLALVKLAPLTSRKSVDQLRRLPRGEELPRCVWEQPHPQIGP